MAAESQPKPAKLYDVEQVRREAQQSFQSGAVTKDYPLDIRRSHELLNEALAAEILCVLRYRRHQVIAKGIDFPQVAAEFAEHADAEQRHMMAIARRIDELGGDPDFNPATVRSRAATEYCDYGKGSSLADMIKENLVAERIVIEIYRRLAAWFGHEDPTSARLIEWILAEEESHASELASLLAAIDPRTEPAT